MFQFRVQSRDSHGLVDLSSLSGCQKVQFSEKAQFIGTLTDANYFSQIYSISKIFFMHKYINGLVKNKQVWPDYCMYMLCIAVRAVVPIVYPFHHWCQPALLSELLHVKSQETGSKNHRRPITPWTKAVPTSAIQNIVGQNKQTQDQFLHTGHHCDKHKKES